MNNNDMVPTGWIHTTIGNVYQVVGGGTPSTAREEYWKGNIPWITSADIEGVRDIRISRYITKQAIENSTTNRVPSKTLLVVTRVGLGKIAIAQSDICFSQDLQGLIAPPELILPEFGLHYLSFALQALKYEGRGTTISGITKKQLKDANFPLPPLNEQKRIVAKIEELFSELDKGIENLKTAREQLKVYRQSVLKHAFEGKLTANWREKNKDKLETADELLERIKQERETTYQQQLEEWEAAVKAWERNAKKGKKPVRPRKQKDVSSPNGEELKAFAKLPPTWKWVKLGELVWSVKDGPHYTPQYSEQGIPFITGGNVRPTGVDFDNVKYISEGLHKELSARCKPELGDLLYTKGGTTGIARVNTYAFEFNVWVHVAVLKFTKSVKPYYLQHALNSPRCYSQSQKYTHGVGNQDLGLTRMVNIILPICSEAEQEQIISTFETLTSEFDEVEQIIEEELRKADVLRQSILKRAFSGKLVAQDPRDEPASVLLERIKAEKNENQKRKKKVA